MKDVSGKELEIGSRVAFIPRLGYSYTLSIGTVLKLTPQKVFIEQDTDHRTCYKFPEQCAKL